MVIEPETRATEYPYSDHPSIHHPPQVKSGTIFDNFLITNDEAYAEEFGKETWGVTKVGQVSIPGLRGRWGRQVGDQALSLLSAYRQQKSK